MNIGSHSGPVHRLQLPYRLLRGHVPSGGLRGHPQRERAGLNYLLKIFFIIVGVCNYVGPRRIRPHPGVQIRRPEAVGRGQDAKAGGHLRRRRRVVS